LEVAQNLPLPSSVSLPPGPRGNVNDDGWCLDTFNEVRRLMTKNVGIVRDAAHLRAAELRLQEIHQQSAERFASEFPTVVLIETVNAALVGRLVVAAALWREESRGLHFRSDFPQTDDAHWLVQSSVQLTSNGDLVCRPLV
jgi:aspartate oxidase